MSAEESALLGRLIDLARHLSEDELEVLCEVASGLQMGQGVYGKLELGADTRRFEAEMLAEIRDALNYAAMRLVQLRRAQRGRGE